MREVRSLRDRDRQRERYRETERERDTERERERERDGSNVTVVALKLAMSLHFSLPKNSHNCNESTCTFPCQKFALFVSPFTFPGSTFLNSHLCGAEIRNEFTLSVAKRLPLFVLNLSNGVSRATSHRNDQILRSPILFFPSRK